MAPTLRDMLPVAVNPDWAARAAGEALLVGYRRVQKMLAELRATPLPSTVRALCRRELRRLELAQTAMYWNVAAALALTAKAERPTTSPGQVFILINERGSRPSEDYFDGRLAGALEGGSPLPFGSTVRSGRWPRSRWSTPTARRTRRANPKLKEPLVMRCTKAFGVADPRPVFFSRPAMSLGFSSAPSISALSSRRACLSQ